MWNWDRETKRERRNQTMSEGTHVYIYIYMYIYMYIYKRRENGRNVTSFWAWPLWPATWLGGLAPHQCRWAGCCLCAVMSWLCVGCCRVWSFFHWPLVSSWTVTLIILGLGFLRARLLWLCVPLLSLQSFYNYARGHCEAARSFFRAMHSVHLISVEK